MEDLPAKNWEVRVHIPKRIVILTGRGREESEMELFRLVPHASL